MSDIFIKPKLTDRILALQNKKQTIAYVYIILTLFTVSFFGLFALRPAFSIIANLQKQLADDKQVYEALRQKLANLKVLNIKYTEIEQDLDMVYQAIPTSAQAPVLLRQLEKLAANAEVSITTLDTGVITAYPLSDGNKLYSYSFTVEVEGTEANVAGFLDSMVSFNRVISFERVVTSKTEKGSVKANVNGTAYFAPIPADK